jgi:hypothetical protein
MSELFSWPTVIVGMSHLLLLTATRRPQAADHLPGGFAC